MPMDPNSPSYIKEESYPSYSPTLKLKETIHFESHLSRGNIDTSITENAASIGYGKWIYKAKVPGTSSSELYQFDINDFNNRQNLRIFSPSSDSNTTLKLPFKIPLVVGNPTSYNITDRFNHSFDLTFKPSLYEDESARPEFDYIMSGGAYSKQSQLFVLDFWFKIPSVNTSFFYIPGYFEYIYNNDLSSDLSSFILSPNRVFLPQHILLGVTNYLDGQKRLICEISRIYENMYISNTPWYQSLGQGLKSRDAIFFIDNNISLNAGDWHHLVIKNTTYPTSESYKIPSIQIWFDDILTFTAYNINTNRYLSGWRGSLFSLTNDSQFIADPNNNKPPVTFKFALSNTIAENTYYQMKLIDKNSSIDSDVYSFNEFHFPDITNPLKFYDSPGSTLLYQNLFDNTVSDTESLEFKDIKYSTITLKNVSATENLSQDLLNPITVNIAKDIEQDLLNPITIQIREDVEQDLLNPITVDAARDLEQDLLNPITIQIREDVEQDLLNPIIISIPIPITPVDPFEISITVLDWLKSIAEIEDYINKTYLGSQQAADDFQLLFRVTDTSYWPVEYTIDTDYHIHIKPDPMYIGVELYACTNKQFLYCKYDMMNI